MILMVLVLVFCIFSYDLPVVQMAIKSLYNSGNDVSTKRRCTVMMCPVGGAVVVMCPLGGDVL